MTQPPMKLDDVPPKVRDRYRDLMMMKAIMQGRKYKEVASVYRLSPRTTSRRVKDIASEMMRDAMQQTQGDPDHPATVRWTVEEFTADPRGCMRAMMNYHIEKLEREWEVLNQ